MIKIANIPRLATQDMLMKMFQKRIKNLKYDNYGIEKDDKLKENYGIAYISSTDIGSITQLVKLHYTVSTFYLFLNICILLDLCWVQA